MKRMLSIFLVLLLSMSIFASCKQNTFSSPLSVSKGDDQHTISIDAENAETILSLLNCDDWISEIPNCGYDYIFNVGGDTLHYQSECGIFYINDKCLSLQLSDADRLTINATINTIFSKSAIK